MTLIFVVLFVYTLFLSYFCIRLVECIAFAQRQIHFLEANEDEKIEIIVKYDSDEEEVDAGGRKGRKRKRSPSETEESSSEEASSESSNLPAAQPPAVSSNSDYESSSNESDPSSTGTDTDLTEDSDSDDTLPLLGFSDSEGEECVCPQQNPCRYHPDKHIWTREQDPAFVDTINLQPNIERFGKPSDIVEDDWTYCDVVEWILDRELWEQVTEWTNEHGENDEDFELSNAARTR